MPVDQGYSPPSSGSSNVFSPIYPNFATNRTPFDTAANSVDIYNYFRINQTSTGITLSIPSPTDITPGKEIQISNINTGDFTITGIPILQNEVRAWTWSGLVWQPSVPVPPTPQPTIDFWRSNAGVKLPDGVTDTTDNIARTGSIGVGSVNIDPIAKVDIRTSARSGTHTINANTSLYVSGDLPSISNGVAPATDVVAFAHSNGTQSIGFAYDGIYLSGTSGAVFNFAQPDANPFQFWQNRVLKYEFGNNNFRSYGCNIAIKGLNDNSNNQLAQLRWEDASGRAAAFYTCSIGGYVATNPEGTIALLTNNGGWGIQQIFTTQINAPPQTVWSGGLNAPAFNVSSLARLKDKIRKPLEQEIKEAFACLSPVRFNWKNTRDHSNKKVTLDDPVRANQWGFVIDDIKTKPLLSSILNKPSAHDEEPSTYDIVQVLALAVAEIKRLGAKIELLERKQNV